MADDVAADLEIVEAGRLPEQGQPETFTEKPDAALDAVRAAFEQAEQGRVTEGAPERARDEAGRFAKAEADKAAAAAAKAPVDPAKPAETPTPAAPEGDTPGAWKGKPDRAALWNTASPELRKAIADREAEVNAGFKMYEGLGPYVREAQANGTTLASAVKDYADIERGLRSNFGEGIKALSERFGIDPRRLGAWLQGLPAPGGPPEGPQPTPGARMEHPAGPSLEDVRSIVRAETAAAARETQILAFFDNPKNKHANDVAPQMAAIIRDRVARNEPVDLKDVYDEALFVNPQTRQLLLTEERAKMEKERVEKENAAAQKARRLGASVKPSAGPTQRPNGRMTPEQAAAAAWDDVA